MRPPVEKAHATQKERPSQNPASLYFNENNINSSHFHSFSSNFRSFEPSIEYFLNSAILKQIVTTATAHS